MEVTIEWLRSQGIQASDTLGTIRVRVLCQWVAIPKEATREDVLTLLRILGGDKCD